MLKNLAGFTILMMKSRFDSNAFSGFQQHCTEKTKIRVGCINIAYLHTIRADIVPKFVGAGHLLYKLFPMFCINWNKKDFCTKTHVLFTLVIL